MSNILVKDGAGVDKYIKAIGAGSDVDPFITKQKTDDTENDPDEAIAFRHEPTERSIDGAKHTLKNRKTNEHNETAGKKSPANA